MSKQVRILKVKGPKTITTRASQISIFIPPNVIYRDLGINRNATEKDVGTDEKHADLTGCWLGDSKGMYDIAVLVAKKNTPTHPYPIFYYGHEEGHAIHVMGQAERLYDEAKAREMEFPVLTREKAREYDRKAREILAQPPTEQRLEDLCFLIHPLEREMVADINGLLTMINMKVHPDKIFPVRYAMERGFPISQAYFRR